MDLYSRGHCEKDCRGGEGQQVRLEELCRD